MRISEIFFIPAFLASVSLAIAVDRRAVSNTVQACIDDMTSIIPKIDILDATIKHFNHSAGYAGALDAQAKEQNLETSIKKAANTCCATSPNTYTAEETDAILTAIGSSTPEYITLMNTFIASKPEVDLVLLWTGLFKTDIKNIGNQTNTLNSCLLSKIPISPASYREIANSYFSQVKSSIDNAYQKYEKNVTSTTTSTSTVAPPTTTATTTTSTIITTTTAPPTTLPTGISDSVKLCIDDMSSIDPKIEILNTAVKQFKHTQGYTGAMDVQNKEKQMEATIKNAANSCCVTSPSTFTVPEADAVLGVVGASTPKYINLFDTLIDAKSEFDLILLWRQLLQADMISLNNQTNTLNDCLLSKFPSSPSSYKETASSQFLQLKSKIEFAIDKYNVTATTALPIPTPTAA